jgi:hypothetical protein
MPVDMSSPSGFNAYWEGTLTRFRAEAVDDHLDGGNLDPINDHVTGAIDQDTLASQYAFPVVWSVPSGHQPTYETVATDHGTMPVTVVVLAADTDPDMAFQKARTLGGRIIDNVEGSALVDDSGTAHASRVDLNEFIVDNRPVSGKGAQVKFAEIDFNIQTERNY